MSFLLISFKCKLKGGSDIDLAQEEIVAKSIEKKSLAGSNKLIEE